MADPKQIEAIARDLCRSQGIQDNDVDMLVSFSPAYEIKTPRGTAYAGQTTTVAPLWSAWVHEALLVIEMAEHLSRKR